MVIPDPVEVEAEADEATAEPETALEALEAVEFPVASPTIAPTPAC